MSICPPYAPFFGFAGVTAAVSIRYIIVRTLKFILPDGL